MAWFRTQTGKSVVRQFAILGSALTGSVYVLPNGLLIEHIKNIYQHYKRGIPTSVPKHLLDLCEEVMQDAKLPEEKSKKVKPFLTASYEPVSFGSVALESGLILGIPWYFNFRSVLEADTSIQNKWGKEVKWDSEAGEDLQEGFVLSENSKKFAIAREICLADKMDFVFKGGYTFLVTISTYSAVSNINERLKLFQKNPGYRMSLYGAAIVTAFAVLWCANRLHESYRRALSDKEASKLGKNYIEGGIAFYEKVLKRNSAMRTILGGVGDKLYSENGNEIRFFLDPLPTTLSRKVVLENNLKYLNKTS